MKRGWFPDFRSPEFGISKSLLTEGRPVDQRVELRTVRKQIQLVSGKGCRILASFETLPLSFSISTCFHRVAKMAARHKKGRGGGGVGERERENLPSLFPFLHPLHHFDTCYHREGCGCTIQGTLYSGTPLIHKWAVLMSDCINGGFFTRKCIAVLPYGPKKVAIIMRRPYYWGGCKTGFHCTCTINDGQEFSQYFLTLLGATFKLVRPDDINNIEDQVKDIMI